MDRSKLSRLITEKMLELGMTQEQFAKYFSEVAKNPVTYGFVQSLTNPKKTSIPEYQNMVGIARMYNVTIDELHEYLTNPDIEDIKDVSSNLVNARKKINLDPQEAKTLLEEVFPPRTLMELGISLAKTGLSGVEQELERVEKLTTMFREMGLSQL